ncbi:tryptophan synthase subunit alpha [Aliidiomarina taiwanensis]|uniref:Tryptophan synthase alpha chain n=1 Tax=Aliidiomarina taiwanensis TaxID=946228 RepID=A0A432X1T4_9GAMM|nr:tryptophan synthase subunit alpha [Aliidiomarina taiwanensis]RUO40541.1 tryptophan synthase subunit alpha [Aliidiomarina taiwanensis]
MSRYEAMFSQLTAKGEGAFVPFITLGDPCLAQTEHIIDALIAGGADALELGLPFSDPVADGPVIQEANIRSLAAGTRIQDCFELLARVRARHPQVPMGLLVYCNLVHAQGLEAFYARCQQAGVDSVLIADVPLRESAPYRQAAEQQGIAPVFICPPDASSNVRQQVAEASQGYVYLLSRAGVTGTGDTLQLPAGEAIQELKQYASAPPLLGFGISQPDHVRHAMTSGAAGAISGSAVVKIIQAYQLNPEQLAQQLHSFAAAMKAATLLPTD